MTPGDAAHEHPEDEHSSSGDTTSAPDWLVRADHSEQKGVDPGFEDGPPPPTRLKLTDRNVPAPDPAAPSPPRAWTAASSSVPTLRIEQKPRARTAQSPAPAEPEAAEDAIAGESDERLESLSTFTDDDASPVAPARHAAPPRVRHEPWWVIALDALRSDSKIQLLTLGLVLLAILVVTFWPRSEPGVSIARLKKDPARWDAQRVRVHGKVGDVFPMGGGYAYYLLQGRDTMVVFTRGTRPLPRRATEVVGTVSTGFLDGKPRQAIFQEPTP